MLCPVLRIFWLAVPTDEYQYCEYIYIFSNIIHGHIEAKVCIAGFSERNVRLLPVDTPVWSSEEAEGWLLYMMGMGGQT